MSDNEKVQWDQNVESWKVSVTDFSVWSNGRPPRGDGDHLEVTFKGQLAEFRAVEFAKDMDSKGLRAALWAVTSKVTEKVVYSTEEIHQQHLLDLENVE